MCGGGNLEKTIGSSCDCLNCASTCEYGGGGGGDGIVGIVNVVVVVP